MSVRKGILEIPEGAFGYRVDCKKDGSGEPWATITDYRGMHTEVRVPEEIEGTKVRALAKKAFLSRKNLRKAILPETLEEIGDWAFAYCTNLESVWLPKRRIKLGSRIFMECPKIKKIYAYEMEAGRTVKNGSELPLKVGEKRDLMRGAKSGQAAALLAAAAVMLDAEYLLDVWEAGTEQWLQKWDARMKTVMETEDDDGYTKMILCGEEDYGCSLEEFVKNKRKNKVRLALLRLLNPIGLEEEGAALWKEYLLAHTKGCESEETWEVILGEHGYEEEYFKLFADIGGMNGDNFDAMLMDMAGDYAEMKAFFISYKEKYMKAGNFFDALSLED